MNIIELKEGLNQAINKEYKYILIDGEAGIGKTAFINKYISKKDIYIPFFRFNKIDGLEKIFFNELISRSKDTQACKINKDLTFSSTKEFKSFYNKIIKEKTIVVLDELESISNNISIKELVSFLEQFLEIDNLVFIIICNSKYLNDIKKQEFTKYKEKIIDKTFRLNKLSNSIIKDILNKIYKKEKLNSNIKEKDLLSIFSNLIEEKDEKNIRIIKKVIEFSLKLLNHLNDIDLSFEEIELIINISYGVIKEQAINFDNDYESLINKILELYLNSDTTNTLAKKFIESILIIYEDETFDKNIQNIKELINIAHTYKEEKDLFFYSQDSIEKKIIKFSKTSIIKYNQKLQLEEWLNELYKYSYYANLIGKNYLIKEDEVLLVLDDYIKNIDCASINLFTMFLKVKNETYKTELSENINKNLKDKLINRYFNFYFEEAKKSYEEKEYNSKTIANLLTFVLGREFKNSTDLDNALKLLRNNSLFIPNLDDELDVKTWNYVHEIWKGITSSDESPNKRKLLNLLIQISNDMYQTASNIGKYRISKLNEYYGILQIKN